MTTPQPKRLYQVWKGSNRFFCGGRLIFGPEVGSLFLSTLLIGGPVIAFCSEVISKIKAKDSFLWYPIVVVAVIVTILDLIFLFLTSSRDPGIVPRNMRPPETEEIFDMATPSMEWVHGRTPHLRLPRTKDVIINGIVVKVKYCDTCLLYRPPRASHCSICDNCVQRFDHHCPWVGQCIGLRNYRFFFLFISTSTFLCIYVFTFSWLNILKHKESTMSRTMSKEIVLVVLIIYCFVAVWFVGGLTVFHLHLISTNQTTYENFRYRYDKKENPHNRGILRNFKELLFSTIPPSMNDFRSWVLEDHIDVGAVTTNMGGDVISPKDTMDIEMGSSKLVISDGMPLPEILQNLDYNGIDDNLKRKDGNEDNAFVPFFFPIDQKLRNSNQDCATTLVDHELKDFDQGCSTTLIDYELRDSHHGCTKEDGAKVAAGAGEGSTSDGATHVNHDNHILQA